VTSNHDKMVLRCSPMAFTEHGMVNTRREPKVNERPLIELISDSCSKPSRRDVVFSFLSYCGISRKEKEIINSENSVSLMTLSPAWRDRR